MSTPLKAGRLLLLSIIGLCRSVSGQSSAGVSPERGTGFQPVLSTNTGRDARATTTDAWDHDKLVTITNDPRLHLVMHEPVVVMTRKARQPFLFCSAQGTLLCQSQLGGDKPFHTKNKIVYPSLLGMAISRDGGATWARLIREKNHDDVEIEGGAVQCRDGTILMLDTYVVPGDKPDHGVGEVWKSRDDFRTWDGPHFVDFYLPTIQFTGSTDDFGRVHQAARLHRSIIEMPNGDLLTTLYCRFASDTAPSAYIPSMLKSRTILVRSRDRGATWAYLSTVAADGAVGTEGFGEPVLARVARGPHAGRLICLMRTGRDLYGARSDDGGVTWGRPAPENFPGIDIRAADQWIHLFPDRQAKPNVPTDDMFGVIADPELIQMQNGTLVCAIGVRIPGRRYVENWRAPENGDYLAFSCDGGDTSSHVVRFRSGQPTTHYMGVREISPGVLYVVYDNNLWGHPGETMGFRLQAQRVDLP